MKKILSGVLTILLLFTVAGCNVQYIPAETPSPTPEELSEGLKLVRPYVEGTVTKIEEGKLYMDEAGAERIFVLTERAVNDAKVLGIIAGDKVLVNLGPAKDNMPVAESLEKILSE